jgi:hypothetical protein
VNESFIDVLVIVCMTVVTAPLGLALGAALGGLARKRMTARGSRRHLRHQERDSKNGGAQ